MWQKATLALGLDYITPVEGFENGDRWNGFRCPAFTKEVTENILTEIAAKKDEEFVTGWRYDAETDTFMVDDGWGIESAALYAGEDITVDGEAHHVYPLGAYSWVWTLENEEEEA